ncbi:MAG: hypothetical protein ACOWWM_12230 [Desulfobacterales bacterium]
MQRFLLKLNASRAEGRFRSLLLLALLLSTACARPPSPYHSPDVAGCDRLIAQVDRVTGGEPHNAAYFRIQDFPYLRFDRFLAGLIPRLNSEATRQAWLGRLRELDREARRAEMAALDDGQIEAIADTIELPPDRTTLERRVFACTDRLFSAAARQPQFAETVAAAIRVPSEYQTWRRAVGLYPLFAVPVSAVSDRAFDRFRERHSLPVESLPVSGERLAFVPDLRPPIEARNLLHPDPLDELGIPRISETDLLGLAALYAPVIVQEISADYDRIGRIGWHDGSIRVDGTRPTAYVYLTHGFLGSGITLQINYTFWYPARDGANSPWFERGPLDGITVRVTLDPEGLPFMVDVMNNCGCYHFYVPDRDRTAEVRNPVYGPRTLVPSWLPAEFPSERLKLFVNSGWHQVDHVTSENISTPTEVYELRPYRTLEVLPYGNEGSRSLFDCRGIGRGSGRIEPLIFFSMGIPSVGSMRQRGHHAIKLVGTEHFDDPGLFDRWFEFRSASPVPTEPTGLLKNHGRQEMNP